LSSTENFRRNVRTSGQQLDDLGRDLATSDDATLEVVVGRVDVGAMPSEVVALERMQDRLRP
jgi:predicted DNA repair protein MutK